MEKLIYIILGLIIGASALTVSAQVRTFTSLQLAPSPSNGNCLTSDGTNNVWSSSCGSGGGGGGGTWSTTTSEVTGVLFNYPNNDDDVVLIGSNASTSAEYFFNPNLPVFPIHYKLLGNILGNNSSTTIVNLVTTNATSTNSTTTNLNVSGTLDVDNLTSAITLTGATGIFAEYAGTSCTNQFVRVLSALGVATCESIGNEDFEDDDWGDITVATNVVSVEDDSHAHTSATISGIDISADTNLTAGDGLTLTDDDLDCDTASGSVFGCLSSADWTTFNNKVSATRALTIAGTANQITSSAGAQDLSADRTWTLSIPTDFRVSSTTISNLLVTSGSIFNTSTTTSATTTNLFSTTASTTNLFVGNSISILNSGEQTTLNGLCVALTGSAGLCDGDDGGGAGSSEWTDSGGFLYPNEATDAISIGTTTLSSNYLMGILATSTSADLIFASTTNGFTADIIDTRDSNGSVVFKVTNNGRGGFGGTPGAWDWIKGIGEVTDLFGSNAARGLNFDVIAGEDDEDFTSYFTAIESRASVGGSSRTVINNQNWTNTVGLRGIFPRIQTETGSTGVITGVAGIYYDNPTISGSTITNNYGIYINSLTGGTNDYGLYIAGADTNAIWVDNGISVFDYLVGIGTSTPRWALQVASSTGSQLTLTDPSVATFNHWSFRNAGGLFYLATSSPTTFATSTTAAFSINANGQIINNGLLLNNHDNLGFAYASTTWTGTSTLRIGPSPGAITIRHAYCETDTGTVGVSLYDGTNRALYMPTASTTINKFQYTDSNNTFTEGESIRVDVGTPASSPKNVSCRFMYTYAAP